MANDVLVRGYNILSVCEMVAWQGDVRRGEEVGRQGRQREDY